MAENDDRIRCRYCGSNNFAGANSCWQCNRPLIASVPDSSKISAAEVPARQLRALPQQQDTQAADRAAIALGLLFPLFGYPIGLAFIMLDDSRKVQLGKLAILWSTIGLVLSLALSLFLIVPLGEILKQSLPGNSLTHLTIPNDDSN